MAGLSATVSLPDRGTVSCHGLGHGLSERYRGRDAVTGRPWYTTLVVERPCHRVSCHRVSWHRDRSSLADVKDTRATSIFHSVARCHGLYGIESLWHGFRCHRGICHGRGYSHGLYSHRVIETRAIESLYHERPCHGRLAPRRSRHSATLP